MRPSRNLLLALAAVLAGCGGGGGNPSPSGPRIVTPPASREAALGSSATFRVVAAGDGLTYQWLKNGAEIPGAVGPEFTIPSVVVADAGEYRIRVTGGGKARTSEAALLLIQGAPVIQTMPEGVSARAGATVTLSVGAEGDSPLAYQWSLDGTPIPGAIDASYTVASVGPDTVGAYTVVVTNPKGRAVSDPAVVSIGVPHPPTISGGPDSRTVAAGDPASFTVVASGTGPLTYQWTKDGADLPGATGATFTIPSAATGDAGTYRVRVTNPEGTATSGAATLTVLVGPAITVPPAPLVRNPGQSATFSVTATGGSLTYQWLKNGTEIAGAVEADYTIPSVTSSNEGAYSVRVTNAAGSVTSAAATLTVRVPPGILQQPRIVVDARGTSVVVVASGTDPAYQWFRNGSAIVGANAATYTLGAVNSGNRGVYSVVVSNAAGSVTSETVNVR